MCLRIESTPHREFEGVGILLVPTEPVGRLLSWTQDCVADGEHHGELKSVPRPLADGRVKREPAKDAVVGLSHDEPVDERLIHEVRERSIEGLVDPAFETGLSLGEHTPIEVEEVLPHNVPAGTEQAPKLPTPVHEIRLRKGDV